MLDDAQGNLYERILAHPLGGDAHAPHFAAKLAAENGWSAAFADRVIIEYRRFAFLGAVCRHPVTPPDAVDQVWHQHVCCTRDYWETFCPRVLGRAFHHEPGNGNGDDARHARQYAQTLAAYARYFGKPAPADIWPRNATGARFERIDRQRVWLVPRLPRRAWPNIAGLVACAALVAGCSVINPDGGLLDATGPAFLKYYFVSLVAWVTACVLALFVPALFDTSGWATPPARLSSIELAYLAGGPWRVIGLVMLRLRQKGKLKQVGDRLQSDGLAQCEEASALEREILARPDSQAVFKLPRKTLELHTRSIAERLVGKRLLHGDAFRTMQATLIHGGALCLALLGVTKVAIGISRGRPVAFLLYLLALLAFLVWRFHKRLNTPRRLTALGRRILKAERERNQYDADVDHDVQYRYAAHGPYGLIGTEWATMAAALTIPAALMGGSPSANASGVDGSSCGSSCGSSDGGGGSCGGGGCGGCGGGGD